MYVITSAPESRTTATRHEVYASGASGKTLPVRIAKQMYGEIWQSKIEPVPTVKLTAYNGGEIECCGVLKNNRIVIQYGKHRYLHQGVNDSERPT